MNGEILISHLILKKILGQAIEAHIRGEYALSIACLSTMWEGLIHHKLHITGRYSQKKTGQGLVALIEENNFDPVFGEFYEKLIVCDCNTVDEVVEGVPNRNGVSHSKYKKYPNKKSFLECNIDNRFHYTFGAETGNGGVSKWTPLKCTALTVYSATLS